MVLVHKTLGLQHSIFKTSSHWAVYIVAEWSLEVAARLGLS